MTKKVSITMTKELFDLMVKTSDIPCNLCVHFNFEKGCDNIFGGDCQFDESLVDIVEFDDES